MNKANIKLIVLVNLFIILTISSVLYLFYNLLIYTNPTQETLYFPYGTSTTQIANQLSEKNVINDSKIFIIAAKLANLLGKNLISGEYSFSKGFNTYKVLLNITKGRRVLRKVIIPEGLTIMAVKEIINKAEGLIGPISENLYECNILPDTYSYYYGDKRDDVVKTMKASLKEFIFKSKIDIKSSLSISEILTLASIIEKETKIDYERHIVAGVYFNRLKVGMLLQADPTIIYAISNGLGVIDHELTRAELKNDSPYNTYTRTGLPPTPIACAGKASILAALNPSTHNYFYFVANEMGGHVFAETLNEHNSNNQARKLLKKNP